MLDLSKTSYKDLVFARGDFLRLVRGPNGSLRPIIIIICFNSHLGSKQLYYSHFGAKKALQRLDFSKTSYKGLVFERCEFLRFFGA